MAYSQATLIQDVRDLLGESPWYAAVITNNVANDTDTTIDVTDGTEWAVGDILEFQDDGEQAYVRSIATNELTVYREFNGTSMTAASHAVGTKVIKNPVFTYKRIQDEIERAITNTWPYCWKAVQDSITPATGTYWYDLASDAIDLVSVYQLFGSSSSMVGTYGTAGSKKSIGFMRNLPAALVTSGIGLRFPGGFYDSTNAVYVYYRAKLTTTVSNGSYSDLSDGLLADHIAYAAAARLLSSKDGPRVSDSDVTMGDATVEPGLRAQVASVVYERRATELRNQYYDELMRTIPPMKKWGK